MVCCVCGGRGPDVIGSDQDARRTAELKGWWVQNVQTRSKLAVLSGSCIHQMSAHGYDGGHRIIYEEKSAPDYRGVCQTCAARIRGAAPQDEP